MRTYSLGLIFVFCILLTPFVLQANSKQDDKIKQEIRSMPHQEINDSELNSLQYVIELQEFSQDIFTEFYQLWRLPLFVNLAHNTDQSIDQLKFFLEKYKLSVNTKKKEGVYFKKHFNKLYHNFITTGKMSLFESLRCSATIEDLKIFDINVQKNKIDNKDLNLLYNHYIRQSRKNIQTIHETLKSYDEKLERNIWLW